MEAIQRNLSKAENVTFRVAGFEDLGDLVIMADEGLGLLSNYANKEHSREKLSASFMQMMGDSNRILVVVRVDGVMVGAMAAYIDTYWFSDRIFSENIFVYVIPRWRGTNIAGTLLNIYKTWARNRGAKDVLFESSSGFKPLATKRFIERQGFRTAGYRLILEDDDG
jgi:GNAT superfamily N-acetyltransferase